MRTLPPPSQWEFCTIYVDEIWLTFVVGHRDATAAFGETPVSAMIKCEGKARATYRTQGGNAHGN